MAQSISDVFARGSNSSGKDRRQARFVQPTSQHRADDDDGADGGTQRRASYRPAETEALRRDVLDAFSSAVVSDGRRHEPERPELLLDAARAAEVLGDFDKAFELVREFDRADGAMTWEESKLRRRILRGVDAHDALRRTLGEAADLDGAPRWSRAYTGLEEAMLAWNGGDDAALVKRRAAKAIRPTSSSPNFDPFVSLWAMQLGCDAALEAGCVDDAFELLRETIELPELDVDTRQALEARRAVWMHVYGRHHEARRLLDELARRGALPGDLDDLLVSLSFEAGDRTRAFTILRSTAGDRCRLREHAVPLVMLHDTAADNSATGRDILGEATEDEDDWTLLRLHETFLDAAAEQRGRGAGTELIDVLNRRLEGPLSVDDRVNTLTRLGRLYEVEAGLEEAAAEVYREALTYDPQHGPALRALGRLYTRRENWKALAELYEREIATFERNTVDWRRHFQLAELYEHRLERDERALENYLVVLEERPNYLPALKSSARILGRLGRWTRLADLFLRMVESAPSRRQKLYLLDKVAEVAETELENFEVAIGAWKEILELQPRDPRAYTALGRLYARTHRWEELISLNISEIELIDDPEEEAAVWLRNAEIAEQNLEDTEAAERYYRKTLDVIPDYLPALEALGRIYLRGGRWAEIVEMTGRELKTIGDAGQATRQLEALAEIFETRLDRRADAISIYEKLWAMDSANTHVFAALSRLYRAEDRWADLEELLNTRLQQNPGASEFAAVQGELGVLAEWKTDRQQRAYGRYLSALQCDPTDIHWLGGVARTWPDADADATEVADELEDLLMHVTEEEIRDRYFTVIARLRERSEGTPEASRAYRAHGSAESLENQLVIRLATAASGERQELTAMRKANPHHPLQGLLSIDRRDEDGEIVDEMAEQAPLLPEAASQWLAGELPPRIAGKFGDAEALGQDLVSLLEGDELHRDDDELDDRRRMRLRALQARRLGDHDAYLSWTTREIAQLPEATNAARRLEIARYATKHQLSEESALYRDACRAVFPELGVDDGDLEDPTGQAIPDVSDEHLQRLYDALRETGRWGLLRRCLESQVSRPEQPPEKRLELFETLAELLEDEIGDYEAARDALTHCWQLAEKPRFLRQIVTLADDADRIDDALKFQRKHFESVSMSSEAAASDRVQSGIWLAELLLRTDAVDDRDGAIDCLEHLEDSYDDVEGLDTARRMLARAHVDAGNGRRAVELFEDVLHFQVRSEELDDWRRLVDAHRRLLANEDGAYRKQWQIVRAFPGSQRDLDTLIDLAAEAGEMQDCIKQLSTLANATADDNKPRLLARAAEAADEELGHAEEAFGLFDRVLELVEDDAERRNYYERRRAVCLARMAGREPRALDAFRGLIEREPFEPSNYRGLETLFERAVAHDRLRITRQTLRMLGCDAKEATSNGKVHPTRSLDADLVEEHLVPASFDDGLFDVLQASMPLVEKVFSDELPQQKALDGRRIKAGEDLPFYDDLRAALIAFGITKFKLYVGENGPDHPQVFSGSTPVVWINQQLLEAQNPAQSRFVAGYCAALVWSDLPALLDLDGRQVWHLIEGVIYRQTDEGFSERVDVASQQMADRVSSPFDLNKRRAIVQAVDHCERDLDQCHCEAWGRRLEVFAARAGLLLSGDLAAAARSLLRLSGWTMPLDDEATQKRLRNQDSVADLVEMAHSEEYLELRYKSGLAGRPSTLDV